MKLKIGTAIIIFGCLTVQNVAAEQECPKSAQIFWKSFREFVLNGNRNRIADYSKFPFEIGGVLDISDKQKVNRKEFLSIYPRLTKTDPGMASQRSTMTVLIKSTPRLEGKACSPSGDEFAVGTWDFVLTAKGWRFVRAHLED